MVSLDSLLLLGPPHSTRRVSRAHCLKFMFVTTPPSPGLTRSRLFGSDPHNGTHYSISDPPNVALLYSLPTIQRLAAASSLIVTNFRSAASGTSRINAVFMWHYGCTLPFMAVLTPVPYC